MLASLPGLLRYLSRDKPRTVVWPANYAACKYSCYLRNNAFNKFSAATAKETNNATGTACYTSLASITTGLWDGMWWWSRKWQIRNKIVPILFLILVINASAHRLRVQTTPWFVLDYPYPAPCNRVDKKSGFTLHCMFLVAGISSEEKRQFQLSIANASLCPYERKKINNNDTLKGTLKDALLVWIVICY